MSKKRKKTKIRAQPLHRSLKEFPVHELWKRINQIEKLYFYCPECKSEQNFELSKSKTSYYISCPNCRAYKKYINQAMIFWLKNHLFQLYNRQ